MKQEGDHWDSKREWYGNKTDLLHDIICMANNLSSQDGLIIIGVDEERDQTLLNSLQGAALDGGRYYIVHEFYITDNMDEELTSRRRFLECILIFDSEFEKASFNKFVRRSIHIIIPPILKEIFLTFPI